MAVVVNTLEDLTKALDEHPEWVDALRARLLPGEVSERLGASTRSSPRWTPT